MPSLLAVDLGLRTGLAAFGRDGRLLWYRSRNFGSRPRLRSGARSVLGQSPNLTHLIVEGGGDLAIAWSAAAERIGVHHIRVDAHTWRKDLLLPRQQRRGADAKKHADPMARRIIAWSGAPKPTSLRHDASEAILVGLWAVLKLGWLDRMPV